MTPEEYMAATPAQREAWIQVQRESLITAADALAAAVVKQRLEFIQIEGDDRESFALSMLEVWAALAEYRKIRPQSAPDGSETAKGD